MNLKQKIVIVDYGVGNTNSVLNAIKYIGYNNVLISENEKDINEAECLILPGVGAFEEAITNLKKRNLDVVLNEEVLVKQKPILGICVGMQLMATLSEENGIHEGLNWIKGDVKKLILPNEFPVPHVGWNNVFVNKIDPLFSRNKINSHFYFDHSYYFDCDDEYISSYCDYHIKVPSAIQKNNIFGAQFHPEKSQTNGLKLFRDFFNSIS